MSRIVERVWPRLQRVTCIEWLILIAIVAVVIAFLLPSPQWASSGERSIPVRVVVFDASRGSLLFHAKVAIVRSPPAEAGIDYRTELRDRLPPARFELTDEAGTATVIHPFRTGANHVRPEPYVHLSRNWLIVTAEGFGGIAIPVEPRSRPSAEFRAGEEIFIPIGLLPVN